MTRRDAVLEGVKPADLAGLRRMALGRGRPNDDDLAGLVAKGWVDMADGMALITLAGRTLLEAEAEAKAVNRAAGLRDRLLLTSN